MTPPGPFNTSSSTPARPDPLQVPIIHLHIRQQRKHASVGRITTPKSSFHSSWNHPLFWGQSRTSTPGNSVRDFPMTRVIESETKFIFYAILFRMFLSLTVFPPVEVVKDTWAPFMRFRWHPLFANNISFCISTISFLVDFCTPTK